MPTNTFTKKLCFLLLSSYLAFNLASSNAQSVNVAQLQKVSVLIENSWVRPTNAGQSVGAAYMTLKSAEALSLIEVKSDRADAVEIHSMTMQNGIMKMRQLKTLALEPNKAVALAPGGFHLMLFGLKKPLTEGEKVHFKLLFKTKNNQILPVELESVVKAPALADENHTHH